MQTAKESAIQLIDNLPDTVTTNDILKELYVKQKIEAGLQASEKGQITSQDEIVKRYKSR